MSAQLGLEFARARRRDPITSHAAADRLTAAAHHHALIVLALKDHGPMTIDEIGALRIAGIDKIEAARRLPELASMRVVRVVTADGSDVTRPGSSGRMQRVWEAL